jgi:hypothetical protein
MNLKARIEGEMVMETRVTLETVSVVDWVMAPTRR